jgi:hypothetical protein
LMAISAEQLNVILSARDREFTRAMERAQRRVESFSKRSNRDLMSTTAAFNTMISAARGLLPALSAGLVVNEVRRVVTELDNIGKTADRLGLTTDALQELRAAAQTAGVNTQTLDMAMQRFGRRLAEARQGAGEAKGALEEMNIELFNADGTARTTEQVLGDVANAMQGMSVQTDRNRIAMRLFDSEGVALVNMLRDGADGLDEMRRQARELGIVIDEDLIRNAEEAEDKLYLMSQVIKVNMSEALINLAPLLVSASEGLAAIARGAADFISTLNAVDAARDIDTLNRSLEQMLDLQTAVDEAGADGNTVAMLGGFGSAAALAEAIANTRAQIAAATGGTEDEPFTLPPLVIDTEEAVEEVEKVVTSTRRASRAAEDAEESYEEMLAAIIANSPALQRLGFDAESLGTVMQSVQGNMESAFMSMIDGTASAQDAFRAMARDIIRELYRVLVVQRLVGSFTQGGGGILGSVFSALSGRASGGSVMANQPYMVGENGREPFIPAQNGRILSTAQAKSAISGGGGAVNVYQTINVTTGVQQTVRAEIKQLMPQIAESAKSAVVDAKRRGGSYGRAFS